MPGRRLALHATIPVCTALIAAAVSGCSAPGPFDAPPCFPPAFSLQPAAAKVGQNVVVTAPDADCDPRYGRNARIHVTVTDAVGTRILDETAPMNDAGGFSYAFDVPPGAAPGAATVTAMPHSVDWCDDTGRNNRMPTSLADDEFDRASCVEPVRILTITP